MYQGANPKFEKAKIDRMVVKKRLELQVDVSSTNAGAISVETPVTALVSAGAETRTLADGYEGQLKIIFYMTDGTSVAITPAHLYNGTAITFTNVNDHWMGVFHAGEWHTVGGVAAESVIS